MKTPLLTGFLLSGSANKKGTQTLKKSLHYMRLQNQIFSQIIEFYKNDFLTNILCKCGLIFYAFVQVVHLALTRFIHIIFLGRKRLVSQHFNFGAVCDFFVSKLIDSDFLWQIREAYKTVSKAATKVNSIYEFNRKSRQTGLMQHIPNTFNWMENLGQNANLPII